MSFNQVALGQRLRAARENRGISQQVVADELGLPRTAVTQMEGGRRSVSTLELAELSRMYNHPISDFFSDEAVAEDDLLLALHRMEPELQEDPEVKNEVARCLAICREGADLERVLGKIDAEPLPLYSATAPRSTGEAVSQGTSVAEQERQRLGLGKTPIADMSDLIAAQGIWVSGAKLPHEMSGLFIRGRSIGMAILVNYDHVRHRKRFSYAHEYAHALLDRERNATISTSKNASDLLEKRANAFAAAFLMPEQGVIELLRNMNKGQNSRQERQVYDVATEVAIEAEIRSASGSQTITYQDIAMIAHHFRVSYQAATFRLRSLNIISGSISEHLLQQEEYGKSLLKALKIWELDEPDLRDSRDRELLTQVVRLAIEAYRRDEISRGRLLDVGKVLGLPGPLLTSLAEAARV
jgi:Zn-dependent peptidase ImmA (M78 family)/transcriptional regulator with XRE-family HTH domain